MILSLLLALVPAHADLVSSTVGRVLTRATDASWVEVGDGGWVRVSRVVRGSRTPGDRITVRGDLPRGTQGVLACGHPYEASCVLALERDGVVWFHDLGLDMHHNLGHLPPGISTLDRLSGLMAGEPVEPLCVRIGDETVHVDAATGRGETPAGPVGISGGGALVVLQRYGPEETVYVGRSGRRGGRMGTGGWRDAAGCLVFETLEELPERPMPAPSP